jgi:Zn-dependent peptidase ImmA (M78 family)
VESIANRLGLDIRGLHLDPSTEVRTMLGPGAGTNPPMILVRSDLSRWQRRLAIAHLVGHLFTDNDQTVRAGAMDTERSIEEGLASEGVANRFANALLVPASWLRKMSETKTVDELSALFDMHPKAIEARAHRIGLGLAG